MAICLGRQDHTVSIALEQNSAVAKAPAWRSRRGSLGTGRLVGGSNGGSQKKTGAGPIYIGSLYNEAKERKKERERERERDMCIYIDIYTHTYM